MDHRSWPWKRKSLDKNPGEGDSSGSASSHSERLVDDQEVRPMSSNSSSNHSHSPEVSSRITADETHEAETAKPLKEKLVLATGSNGSSPQVDVSTDPEIDQPEACQSLEPEACQLPQQDLPQNTTDDDVPDSVKSLNVKLSAALLTISAKEDLVKQHTKVAEEAVAGWEQAEAEVAALKQQLETTSQKNTSLEDQVSQLDDALKECVRQLRQAREEQEEKIGDALAKKSKEFGSEKTELQVRIAELSKHLEASKLEAITVHVQHDLQEKTQILEKENKDLRIDLVMLSKELKILARERDLSNQAAETASKLHLESVKKIARVEAECLRLRHMRRRTSLANDSRHATNNTCMESQTDSQSDSGECMLAIDDEMKKSDSWAYALMAELDQFKNGSGMRNIVDNPVEIDLMDDFLEMEKLAALPEVVRVSSSFGAETDSDQGVTTDESSKVETESLHRQVTDLHAKFEKIEGEKKELETALAEARDQLGTSCDALMVAKGKLVDSQKQLDLVNESKRDALRQVEWLDNERKDLASLLELKCVEVEELRAMVASLEGSVNCKELEVRLETISAEAADLRKTVASLEEKIDAERSLAIQHKANTDMAEAAKELLDAQLRSANKEIGKLRGIMEILETEMQKEKVHCEELVKQMEAMTTESKRTVSAAFHIELLEAQLQVVNSEVAKLQGTVNALECDASKEKAYSSDLQMQLEAVEGIRKVLESELELSHQGTMKLREKVLSLETRLKDQTSLLVEYTAKSEDAVSRRKTMEGQLEAANLELTKLRNKVGLLQGKIERERLLSEEYEAKCRKLEAQLSRDSREAKLWRLANSNGDLKEKDLSSAAGKLAECQKTIANLGRQLKSLTDLDDVASETEKLELESQEVVKDGDAGLLSADLADGLYELDDLPKRNCRSCVSPMPSNGSSSPSAEMSVFSGGSTSLSSYLSKIRK